MTESTKGMRCADINAYVLKFARKVSVQIPRASWLSLSSL